MASHSCPFRIAPLLCLAALPGCRDDAPNRAAAPIAKHSAPSAAVAHPSGPARSCALSLSKAGRNAWSVTVELQNRTDRSIEARYHHPMAFALEVWSESKRLEVQTPPFDGPVEPRSVTVAPGERVRIATPVVLHFDAAGRPDPESPFDWYVMGAPTRARLRATRVFSDAPDLPCDVRLHVHGASR